MATTKPTRSATEPPTHLRLPRRAVIGSVIATALAATGCASRAVDPWASPPPPAPKPTTPPSSPTAPAPAAAPTLQAPATGNPAVGPERSPRDQTTILLPERKYLAERFAGTPVTIDFDGEGALIVEVPLAFAFDPGKDTLKPALTKVLDYVATSLRRVQASRFTTSGPSDAKPNPGLASRRAEAVSQYIVSRGVNALRAAGVVEGAAGSVQVRIVADRTAP